MAVPHEGEPPVRASPRDRAIDVLRGTAIVLMIVSHVGRSRVGAALHLPLWVSAATPFVLLSGLVLGRRMATAESVLRRAGKLWVIHVALMVMVIGVHESTGRLDVPWLRDAGGLPGALWKVPLLRLQSLDFMNILPLFVVFFAAAPAMAWAMRRRATAIVLGVSIVLWGLTQAYPAWLRFTDPTVGAESFVLPAWQLVFVLGLAGGFHWESLLGAWPKIRSWALPLVLLLASALFVLAQLQRNVAAPLGARLPLALDWLVMKETWGPVRAVYELALLVVGYLGLAWLRGRPAFERLSPLELMGRKSLYCFLMHLPLALAASALHLNDAPGWAHELAAVSAVLAVYLCARHDVLGRYVPS